MKSFINILHFAVITDFSLLLLSVKPCGERIQKYFQNYSVFQNYFSIIQKYIQNSIVHFCPTNFKLRLKLLGGFWFVLLVLLFSLVFCL